MNLPKPRIEPVYRLCMPKRKGFALIVTLMLLALLSLLCVGMLSLSSITLRSSSSNSGLSVARSNARMALMLAIGQLQAQLGPDQRVSANGAILGDPTAKHPMWTGVWDSWKAGPTASGGDALSDHRTIPGVTGSGMAPTYLPGRSDHFRSWLLSLYPEEAAEMTSAKLLALDGVAMPEAGDSAIRLVGEGSLGTGDTSGYVSARLLLVPSASGGAPAGRYGWWVGDESQKARIMDDSYESSGQDMAGSEFLFRQQAPASAGNRSVSGLEDLDAAGNEQLAHIPSLRSLGLVGGATETAAEQFHSITPYSYKVLCDVREGGLQRDLTTILESPIRQDSSGNPLDIGDEFMLYKFNTKDSWLAGPDNQEAVPIHDLAAYYQLYESERSGWKEGIRYSSNVGDGIQIVAPDYGVASNPKTYLTEYTALYKQPVPVKVQMLFSVFAEPIVPSPTPTVDVPDPDTHELLVGVTPAVTFWNPTNQSLSMRFASDPNVYSQLMRFSNLPIMIEWDKNSGGFVSQKKNLFWFVSGVDGFKSHLFNLFFGGKRQHRFAPGEAKVFSLPYSGDVSGAKEGFRNRWTGYADEFFFKTDLGYFEPHETVSGWDPRSFMLYNRSAPRRSNNAADVANTSSNLRLTFKESDQISINITSDNTQEATMAYSLIQSSYQSYDTGKWFQRNYSFNTRSGSGVAHNAFIQSLFRKGFENPSGTIKVANRSGSQIIARSASKEGWPFLQFSLMAGVETNEESGGGLAGGRRFPSRPFTHSTPFGSAYLDNDDGASLYNYGWNWFVQEINDVFEAPVQVSPDGQSYFGGGYTPEYGTTHVVQQEIPLVPPISIASLSHAHLGGFSIARSAGYYAYTPNDSVGSQHVTAHGQAGLFPHTLQAIGNSYAHPNIPADKAYRNWASIFNTNEGARNVTLADHSYLANKSLWDEYFFSSIHPRNSSVRIFNDGGRSAVDVAQGFFFADEPLPNRRIVPYMSDLTPESLNELMLETDEFQDGTADKIAANLMVEGPFNVNSTSVEAWKILFSSLKEKKVAFLDKDKAKQGTQVLEDFQPGGVPLGAVSLPNGGEVSGSPNDPAEPEQWYSWRVLTDTEIEELAEAMVEQVRLRGPFLSLSDFINRRLDASNPGLSVKGALQAAIDDEDVSINLGFRASPREMSDADKAGMTAAFPEALDGPVAYGSSAYIDQADVLRHLAGQLTPRGDTFVIRAYGDALDSSGNVIARAWCEAAVQRFPEYLDPQDEPYVATASLGSGINRSFGRRIRLVGFRWLAPSEI